MPFGIRPYLCPVTVVAIQRAILRVIEPVFVENELQIKTVVEHTQSAPARILTDRPHSVLSASTIHEKRQRFAEEYEYRRTMFLSESSGHDGLFETIPDTPTRSDTDLAFL